MKAYHILEYLEQTARRAPARVAFADETQSCTFSALKKQCRAIGAAIAEQTQPRKPVVLLMNDRSVACVAAMLGVLYAGCCYVPLDVSLPAERLMLIAENLRPALVLHDERGEKAAAAFDCARLTYDAAAAHDDHPSRLAAIRAQTAPDDPMAILFTSGSTGIPKGVVQSMRSHLRYTEATIEKYGFTEKAVFGNQSPFYYANSIIDIFPTLALGAKTVILPAAALAFPAVLTEQLNRHSVTELTMTPSSYVKAAAAGVLTEGCLPHLRYIVLSGEAAHWATMQKWLQAAPNGGVWNFYGSTELYSVAVWKLNGTFADAKGIPVGPLFDGVDIRFLNEDGAPASPGKPGEMVIHTPWLAAGYYNDAERTEAAFETMADGRRFYRTGDIGFLDADGRLTVLGRKDTQIKHMGYRMEIGEVEQALLAAEGVTAGCCLFDKDSGLLHCFYAGKITPKALASLLKRKLPRYAIPDRFHQLDALPYTSNAKMDRQKLRRMM